MTSVSEELQAALREAERAQQLEDDSNHNAAIDSYYRAICQLSYLLDIHVEKGSVLEQICKQLVNMHQQRLTVLRNRAAAAEEAHWVQLEQCTGPNDSLASSTRSSISTRAATAAACPLPGPVAALPLQAVVVGAGGMQSAVSMPSPDSEVSDITQLSCEADPQTAIELLRMCQRQVQGSLDDVVGLEDVKEEIEEAVFLPMQHPYLFKGMRQPVRTFLLYGPPGTGKTMLVEKIAAEAELNLLAVSPSMILSKWSGDSEKAISQVFDLARAMQPSLLFMDEIDSIGQSRDGNTDPGSRRLLTELLIQFNGVTEEEGIYIFAATNRMQDCDQALLRRFSRRIEVPLPATEDRQAFFQSVLQKPEMDSVLSLDEVQQLAEQTVGYSGSDLAALCRLAAMAPVRELFQQQRQQRTGCKRRRLCQRLRSHTPDTVHSSQQQATQDPSRSCFDCTAAQPRLGPTQQDVPGFPEQSAAGVLAQRQDHEGAVDCTVADKQLQLRQLVYADFQAALQKVKPAAADAQVLA